LKRFFRAVFLVVVLAGVFAAAAAAFGFTDQAQLPPDMQLGSPYSFQLSARSGCPPYYYEAQSGLFPPGISMSRDGLISGTPQIGGTFKRWLAVKNQCPGDSSERLFTFYVVDPRPFVITTSVLKAAERGLRYQAELISSESGALTWTLNAGQLPAGLKLSADDGLISGTPAVTGSFGFRVKVNDGRRSVTKDFTLAVGPKLAFVTTRLSPLSVGRTFRARIAVRGGVGPLRWKLARGSLPTGVRLGHGVLAGTPRRAGTFRVLVRVTDSLRASSTRTFVLVVRR
jgi:hypothetical protein